MEATLDTVYGFEPFPHLSLRPTVTVEGGTVNVYVSNALSKPANIAAMESLDDSSPLADTSVNTFTGLVRWIAFEAATSTPTVRVLGAKLS